MKLSELLYPIKKKISGEIANIEISEICENSALAHGGAVFVAINGYKADGSAFIDDAKMRGARVAVTENKNIKSDDILIIYVKNARKALAVLSARLVGNPERKMKIIGITGTKGKSTTAFLLHRILNDSSVKNIFIGSFGVLFDGQIKTQNTTPSPVILFRELAFAYQKGVRTAIIEVSSQALKDFRVYGIPFFITAFTSLGNDHVGEYEHKSRADYISAKHSLFSSYGSSLAIVNGDDPYSSFIASGTPRVLRCGFFHHNDVIIEDFCEECSGSSFRISDTRIHTLLRGEHNAINTSLAVMCSCIILKKTVDEICGILNTVSIEGRFEEYTVNGRHVVIDYAHTPESFTAVSNLARRLYSSRQIAVFGSVSNRAYGRRKLLAKTAERAFDYSIITGDDVCGDDANEVCLEIYSHFTDKSRACVVCDREEAIKKALRYSKAGDTVLLLGKGQEKSIIKGGKEVYFDEHKIISDAAGLSQNSV